MCIVHKYLTIGRTFHFYCAQCGGQYLPSLVEIGLTDQPKSGGGRGNIQNLHSFTIIEYAGLVMYLVDEETQ